MRLGGCFVRNGEGHVRFEPHRGHIHRAQIGENTVIDEGAHAGACHNLIAETLPDLGLLHKVLILVIPTGLRGFVPLKEPHHPCELQHACGGEIYIALIGNPKLGL